MKFQSVPSWTLKITRHSGSKIYLNYIIVWIVLWDALNAGHCKQPPCEKIRRETAINLHGVLHGVQSKVVGGTRGRRISASKQIQWSDIVSWYKQIELWSGVCSVYLKLFKDINIALGNWYSSTPWFSLINLASEGRRNGNLIVFKIYGYIKTTTKRQNHKPPKIARV